MWKKALCIAHCLIAVVTLVLVALVYKKVSAQGFGAGFVGQGGQYHATRRHGWGWIVHGAAPQVLGWA
jgi:drug/metabolite transporter superfamily protein YnfA